MSEGEESSSRERTREWLEDILGKYKSHSQRKKDPKSPPITVTVVDFDIGPGIEQPSPLHSTLSDLLSLSVTYKIDGESEGEDKITDHLVVKIPPNDKAVAAMAQVDKREIHFYTEALVELEEWALGHCKGPSPLKLSVPKCLFAKYHLDPSPEESTNLPDAESVLVLEDLRPLGFSMRDFSQGLSLAESKAALGEIGKVHAISWAMQEASGFGLDEKWHFAYRPRKAASAYRMMIEQGFPTLAEFLNKQGQDGLDLLKKLKELYPKAAELLCELLESPPPPLPSCLVHMDFWSDNLMFRTSSDSSDSKDNSVECRILDWQMMAISRPTHDIALLLFTSLTPPIRRQHTQELLTHYFSVFEDVVVSQLGLTLPFDFTVIEEEFKKSQLLALLLVIGSIDLALDKEATEERLMEALKDLSKAELI